MTHSATLTLALAAYRPGVPHWQQQRQYQALRRATTAMAEAIERTVAKLGAQWNWLTANPEHPDHDAREEGWIASNQKYEAAWRLYQDAVERLAETTP